MAEIGIKELAIFLVMAGFMGGAVEGIILQNQLMGGDKNLITEALPTIHQLEKDCIHSDYFWQDSHRDVCIAIGVNATK